MTSGIEYNFVVRPTVNKTLQTCEAAKSPLTPLLANGMMIVVRYTCKVLYFVRALHTKTSPKRNPRTKSDPS